MANTDQDFLRNLLLEGQSRPLTHHILSWVRDDAERVAALCASFLEGPYRITQRAAWPIGDIGKARPELLLPHLSVLIGFAKKEGQHDAVARNVLRILESIDLPDELLGEAADLAFPLAADPQKPVAIRAFALTAAWKICQNVPELAPELRLIIEDAMPHATPAIKVRCRRILEGMAQMPS